MHLADMSSARWKQCLLSLPVYPEKKRHVPVHRRREKMLTVSLQSLARGNVYLFVFWTWGRGQRWQTLTGRVTEPTVTASTPRQTWALAPLTDTSLHVTAAWNMRDRHLFAVSKILAHPSSGGCGQSSRKRQDLDFPGWGRELALHVSNEDSCLWLLDVWSKWPEPDGAQMNGAWTSIHSYFEGKKKRKITLLFSFHQQSHKS